MTDFPFTRSIHLHVENQHAFSSSIVILNDYTRTPYDYP